MGRGISEDPSPGAGVALEFWVAFSILLPFPGEGLCPLAHDTPFVKRKGPFGCL